MAIPVVNATVAGTVSAPVQVTSSEVINGNLADTGAVLRVNNGSGSPVNVGFTDPGRTAAGNTGTQSPTAVATGTSRYFDLDPAFINAANNQITATFSATGATITAEIITST